MHGFCSVYPSLRSLAFIVLPVYSSSNLGYVSRGPGHNPRFPRETSTSQQQRAVLRLQPDHLGCAQSEVHPHGRSIIASNQPGRDGANRSFLNPSPNDPLKWIIHPQIKASIHVSTMPLVPPPERGSRHCRAGTNGAAQPWLLQGLRNFCSSSPAELLGEERMPIIPAVKDLRAKPRLQHILVKPSQR